MIRQIYGDEQFMKWRRGYDTPPPPISSFSHACKEPFSTLFLSILCITPFFVFVCVYLLRI
jgi:hypothetical protein